MLWIQGRAYPDEDPLAVEVDVRDGELAGKRHVDVWECKFECEIDVVPIVCTRLVFLRLY